MIDISNLTYKELEELKEKINEREKEVRKAEYTGLINSVQRSIEAIISAGFGSQIAYYDDDDEELTWYNLLDGMVIRF